MHRTTVGVYKRIDSEIMLALQAALNEPLKEHEACYWARMVCWLRADFDEGAPVL
jgi:hypothetical protein